MDLCRTCLKTPANKNISELEQSLNEQNKNYCDIMMFCLNIEIIPDSKITTKLCSTCYRKIISFYDFKAQSLRNDVYLRSLSPTTTSDDRKVTVYVDENAIKHENPLDEDEYGPSIVEDIEFKIEIGVKYEDKLADIKPDVKDENLLGDTQIIINDTGDIKDEKSKKALLPTEQKNNIKKKSKVNIRKKTEEKVPKKRGRKPKAKYNQEYQMCEECGKAVRNMRMHSIIHQPKEERKLLPCKVSDCPKIFFTLRGQKYHYKHTHLGLKFKCDICDKEVANLKTHKSVVHEHAALTHVCVTCDRRFVSQSVLDAHMTSHTQVHAYECDACQKKFRSKTFVRRHIRQVHEKERRFQCEFCSKGFFRKTVLQEHIRSHTKERPHKCEDCGKAFSLIGTLKSHRLIHGNERRFQCELCDKSFIKPGYLKAHMISHTKEKRYPCQYCGVRFHRSDHRKRHEFTAHQKHHTAD